MEEKTILITGGAGFIGSNIVEYLLKNDKTKFIRILDNLSTGKKENIEFLLEKYDNLEFMYGDISNLETCRKAVKGVNLICHQAALGSVPRSVEDPLSSHVSNVNGFLNILLAAKEEGIKRIVYASSSSVYGDDARLPKQEDNTGDVLSPYAATKLIDEIYAGVFTKCYGMECIGLRYFNIFGPRQDPNGQYAAVIPKFIDLIKKGKCPTINGDGSFSRDFTYVDNAVYANYLALTTENAKCFGQAFNIGCGGKITILELFNTIKKKLNKDIEAIFIQNRAGDVSHSNADISKAIEYIGYRCLVNFEEGINKTTNYYSSEKSLFLKNINYNNLLNRKPIIIDNSITYEYLKNKKILITGGCGSIGSEIVRQLLNININDIVVYDNSECGIFNLKNELNYKFLNNKIKFYLGDILDIQRLEILFKTEMPIIIFHCAAYKHVPIMEDNPNESIKVNIIGTKNIADLTLRYNAEKFIMISTDKAVNPTSIMGSCKRISEIYINYLNIHNKTHFITTRFGNVLGSSGSVVPTFMKKIKNGLDIELTHAEITRYFMTISEASQLVINASYIGKGGEILLFDMGKPIKILDLATKLIDNYNNITCSNRQINITYIGLRPGEKLYEELLCKEENIIKTENDYIMKLKHSENINYDSFFKKYNLLINKYYDDFNELKKDIKEIIPEYMGTFV